VQVHRLRVRERVEKADRSDLGVEVAQEEHGSRLLRLEPDHRLAHHLLHEVELPSLMRQWLRKNATAFPVGAGPSIRLAPEVHRSIGLSGELGAVPCSPIATRQVWKTAKLSNRTSAPPSSNVPTSQPLPPLRRDASEVVPSSTSLA
jgi:hypothetical protein